MLIIQLYQYKLDMTQQVMIERKPLYCRNNCGIEITFIPGMKSKSGKMIPVQKSNGLAHQCPNSPYALQHRGQQPKHNGESKPVTKQPEEDIVFDLLMEISKKLDMVLDHFEAMK